jgi:hypothetical protein
MAVRGGRLAFTLPYADHVPYPPRELAAESKQRRTPAT